MIRFFGIIRGKWCKFIRSIRFKFIQSTIDKQTARSVICNNCVGAMILHDFGLKFNSPFVNLFIEPDDYIELLSNIKYYLSDQTDLKDISQQSPYPIGLLNNRIKIHFLHYKSFEDAKSKWINRCRRLNFSDLYVIFVQQKGWNTSHLKAFQTLNFEHKIMLVNKPDLAYYSNFFYLPGWENEKQLGTITDFSNLIGSRYFDYVNWKTFLNI